MPINPKKTPRARSSGRKILSSKATTKTMASVLMLFIILADDIIGYADREGLASLPSYFVKPEILDFKPFLHVNSYRRQSLK
jgi:hypothetical protein